MHLLHYIVFTSFEKHQIIILLASLHNYILLHLYPTNNLLTNNTIMKKRNALLLALTLCLSAGFVSCSDDDNKKEEKGVVLQTIQATTPVLYMSERAGWNLKLGYMSNSPIEYSFTIDGNKLTAASPKAEAYYFDKSYQEGDKMHPSNGLTIRLASPDYYGSSKSSGPKPPRIQDQSTDEKFRNADLLSSQYQGVVSKDIKDVVLTHDNALLDFVIESMPAGAKVIAYQNFTHEITPLPLVNSQGKLHYQAIVLSGYSTAVAIIINDKYYVSYLFDENTKANRNTRYTFDVKLDIEEEKLIIENLKSADWNE